MENRTEHINQGRPVYFSYARNSSKKPEWEHISDCVNTLLETLTAKNLEYRVDVRDIGTGGNISSFEQEIGWKSEVVVVVFSDKYFRSMHCMYEFMQIKNALKQYPEKKLFCIKSGDINLSDVNYIMELEDYWLDLKNEYEKIEYHRLREHSGTEKAAWQNGFYLEDIRQMYSFFSAINYSNAASINYDSFVDAIVKYYKTTPKPDFTPKPAQLSAQPQPQTAQPQSAQPQPQQHTAQPQQHTAQPQPQTRTAQPKTALQLQTRPAQPKPTLQYRPSVQQVASTPQPEKKKSSVLTWIAIILIGIIAISIINSGSSSDSSSSGNDSHNSYVTDNVGYDAGGYSDDDDAIFNKADQLYRNGNISEAIVLLEKLANKGHALAQVGLAHLYFEGLGVAQNYKKSFELYRKSAEQGNLEAQYCLGVCYFKGYGVRQSISEGKKWIQKAADQGYTDAIETLRNLGY